MPERKSQPIDAAEHLQAGDVDAKKVMSYGWTGSAAVRLKVNTDGTLNTTAGAGTQYNTGDAYAEGNSGTGALVVRDDAGGSLVTDDGDYTLLQVNSSGALRVTGGGGGTEYTEDDVSPATPDGSTFMMTRDDALSSITPAEGDWTRPYATAEGALWTQDFNSDAILSDTTAILADTAIISGAVSGGQMQVDIVADGAGLATSANQLPDGHNVTIDNASGGSAVNIQDGGNSITVDTDADATDGAAHGASQTGFRAMGTDGTNDQQVAVDSSGNVQVDIVADAAGLALAANQLADGHNVTIDNASGASAVNIQDGGNTITVDGTVTADAGTGTFATSNAIVDGWDNAAGDGGSVSGDVAHDTADAGEPVKVGAKAYDFDGTAPQTAVAEADRVNLIADPQGIQYVQTAHPFLWDVSVDYGSAQTNATVKAAPGAGLKLYITDIIISNGTTAGEITLLDGSGGTVLLTLYPAANGGMTHSFKNPIALTANTLLALSSVTVTDHSATIAGFIAA